MGEPFYIESYYTYSPYKKNVIPAERSDAAPLGGATPVIPAERSDASAVGGRYPRATPVETAAPTSPPPTAPAETPPSSRRISPRADSSYAAQPSPAALLNSWN